MNPERTKSPVSLSLYAKPDRVSFYRKTAPPNASNELLQIPELLELVADVWKPEPSHENTDGGVKCMEVECPSTLPYPLPAASFTVHLERGIIRDEDIVIHRVFHHSRSFPAYASVGYVVKDNVHSCMICGDDWRYDSDSALTKGPRQVSPFKLRQPAKRRGVHRASSASVENPWFHCRGCGNLVCADKCIAPTMVLIEELCTLPVQHVCKQCHWGTKVISARPSAVHGVVLSTLTAPITLRLSSTETRDKPSSNMLALVTHQLPDEARRERLNSSSPNAERVGSSDSRRHWSRLEDGSTKEDDELARLALSISSSSIADLRPPSPARNVHAPPESTAPRPLPAPLPPPSIVTILTPKRSCGYLSKMHSTWHLWQSRYFVLDKGFLHHFKPRRFLARTLLRHPVYKAPSGEWASREKAIETSGGSGGGGDKRQSSPGPSGPPGREKRTTHANVHADSTGGEPGLTLHTLPSMESLIDEVQETPWTRPPSPPTEGEGEGTFSPSQPPSPSKQGGLHLRLPGKRRQKNGGVPLPHYSSIRDPACHLDDDFLASAFKLRCTYNVLNFKLVSVANSSSLMQLVQIMPHLGAAPNSKDRVVLYLKAKNPADKEAWMADYTAHALYAMHVKMRQLVSPISEES